VFDKGGKKKKRLRSGSPQYKRKREFGGQLPKSEKIGNTKNAVSPKGKKKNIRRERERRRGALKRIAGSRGGKRETPVPR